jgi:hypothetical protein
MVRLKEKERSVESERAGLVLEEVIRQEGVIQ